MPKRLPPLPPPVPTGDDFAAPPRFTDGPNEATTGPRDYAELLGPPSRVVKKLDTTKG